MLARGYVTRRNQPSTRPTLTLAAGLVRSHTITGMRRPLVLSNTVTFTFVRKEIITSGRFAFIRRSQTRNLSNPEDTRPREFTRLSASHTKSPPGDRKQP